MSNQFADQKILEKYYDLVRIIDPLAATPIQDSPAADGNSHDFANCHQPDSSNRICENCIALQAIQQQETFFKIHMQTEKCFMITAMPIEIGGRTVALELIKRINEKTIDDASPLTGKGTDIYRSLAKLNDLAVKDALTTIYNRRYINNQLPAEIFLAKQRQLPFSVLMADIDFFKQINDQYGHSVGDEVLNFFALQLQKNIRRNNGDWVARYGGEEFLIVLTNCGKSRAYKIAEKLRRIIEQTTVPTAAGRLHITASFGVHTFSGEETDLHQLVDKVDTQLYQAKQTGRNCTVSAISETRPCVGSTDNGVFC